MSLVRYKILCSAFFLITFFNGLHGQTEAQYYFLNHDLTSSIDDYFIKNPDIKFHSSQKPFNYVMLQNYNDLAVPYRTMAVNNWFMRKELFERPNFRNHATLHVLPQIELEQGYDMLKKKFANQSAGGVYLRADVNSDFSAAFQIVGGQISMPNFLDTITKSYNIVPGQGMAYGSNGKYTYANLTGYLSYSPIKQINFQLAKDKIFIGDGYRSLLLSDVANNYPYFKTQVNIWHFQYSAWYSWFKDVYGTNGQISKSQNRFGTFHYLSWNAFKNFNISAFENVIWQGTDTSRVRGFDANYLNPIIFFRPVEYSVGSSDNSMLGFNINYSIVKRVKLYGQFVMDEFYLKEIRARKGWWANKQGFQLGVKYIDAFGLKKLTLQAEFNYVRPYTYSHGSPQQNYSHYNQALAHPLGANFKEFIGIAQYKHNRYRIDVRGLYAIIGKDTNGVASSNVGQNIFLSYTTRPYDYGHFVGQGINTKLLQLEIRYTYLILPKANFRFEVGLIQRSIENSLGFLRQTPYVYVGLKTSLGNFYRDY